MKILLIDIASAPRVDYEMFMPADYYSPAPHMQPARDTLFGVAWNLP
jgi:hypothetical protein